MDKFLYMFMLIHLFSVNAIGQKPDNTKPMYGEVVKDDGKPYVVYTPYSKKWKENFRKIKLVHYPSEEKLDRIVKHSYSFLSLTDIGFEKSESENLLLYN